MKIAILMFALILAPLTVEKCRVVETCGDVVEVNVSGNLYEFFGDGFSKDDEIMIVMNKHRTSSPKDDEIVYAWNSMEE